MAIMAGDDILKGKKILVVDDEPDVLESLKEILQECDVETASSYESAKELFERIEFDAAILDIMGVRGFDLLEIAIEKKIPALMLTAHGLNPDNLVGSIKLQLV
jgi:DNA-binding response OmpR family regulator